MKKQQKALIVLGALLTLVAAFIFLTNSIDVTVGLALAFAAPAVVVAGTPTVASGEDVTPDNYREDISEAVTQMMPSRTPIDTIVRNTKKAERATSQKIGYYQASYKPMTDTFDSSATGAGTSSGAAASSYTIPSSNSDGVTVIYLQVSNPDIWRTADTFLLQNLTLPGDKGAAIYGGTGTHKDDVMFYIAEKDGAVIKCIPMGGVKGAVANKDKFIVPTFAATDKLIRMGQAKSELSITTDPFAIYPSITWQYCQNFMAQIEQSTFDKLTEKEAAWNFSNFEIVNLLSMRMEMEMSFLFGQSGEYVSGNDKTYFTRGITRDIERNLVYGTGSTDRTVSKGDYHTWLKEVFDGNNGSEKRTLFAGSGLLQSLGQVDEYAKQLTRNESRNNTLGFSVTSIVTNFGELEIVHHPLLNEAGWGDNGIILDLEHVSKHEFVPMSVTELDLKKSGQKNADARVIQEVSALTLRYPDCHAIIRPKA